MRFNPCAIRELSISYNKPDLVAVALIGLVVASWAAVAAGAFSMLVLGACEVLFFTFYVTGSIVAGFPALGKGVRFELPLRLLVGYGIINTALLVLAWGSPLGMLVNFGILLAAVMSVFFAGKKRECGQGQPASLWVVGIGLIATSLWCQDSIDPIIKDDNLVVFKPWVDGFYHAVHVRIFAESHGASSIEDFRMAEVPARLYHYGVYMLPAFVKAASGLPSYAAFAGILAPVGVFFTGLAAYSFFGSVWGAWPGVAAASALLLLPDGAQQGMQNPFMSYHWLTQISPSATYGLALLAVAWLFVIQGSQQGSRLQLAVGWLAAAVVGAYKLHYVIASALLLLLVPVLFFRATWSVGKRALAAAVACACYAASLTVLQKVPGVPLIRFDGSSNGEILRLIQSFVLPGALKEYLGGHMGADFSGASNLLYGVPYVLLAVLGVFAPALGFLVPRLRKHTSLLCVAFPVLLAVNFLAMFFGLALDMSSSTPDELSHRPLMIVYFFVVPWIGGAVGLLVMNAPGLRKLARPVGVGLVVLLMAVPATLGEGVQRMWVMNRISPVRLPRGLVDAAAYIRDHGGPQDIFQDSQFDRFYAISALAERRTFVAHTLTRMPFRAEQVGTRSAAVNRLMLLRQGPLALGTARAFGIRWFVLHLGNPVNWPAEIADHPVFEAGPIKVYDLK
jgi:hypothetical protein